MTAATLTIADFLLARIADDEAVARAATPGPWWHDPTKWNSIDHEESVFAGSRGLDATTVSSTGPGDDPQSMADAVHIARHDPTRVLAECAAKRAIVERFETSDDIVLYPVVEALASVYADHADFDSRWAS